MIDGNTPVAEVMTLAPITIEAEAALADARRVMAGAQIRHLPVTRRGQLVGILSARDILVAEDLRSPSSSDESVESAMAAKPISVTPDTAIRDVLKRMAQQDVGAILVILDDELSGIFTDVDAVKLLAQLLS